MFHIAVLICFAIAPCMETLKVLVLYPLPAFSLQRPIIALTEKLVEKGHELFVVSPNSVPDLMEHKNYTHCDLSFAYEYYGDNKKIDSVNVHRQVSKWDMASKLAKPVANLVAREFTSEQFLKFKQRLESEKTEFDIVIVQSLVLPFLVPMAKILAEDAPIISISSSPMDWGAEDLIDKSVHLSFLPSIFGHYTDKMDILQKLENWFSHPYILSAFREPFITTARKFLKETYGPGRETLVDGYWQHISLTLIASNSLYYYPRLLGPNIIEVGPVHFKPPKELPENLQDWLDGAEKGVIYFSLGSNMKSKALPKDVLDNFLKFFRELPAGYRVLWKWELDGPIPGQSDNIMTQKWMPQDSILAHPKVKLFITQGGLQSFQEAVHFGVPTVGIPWFVDQECVTAKMVDAKIGVKVSPQEIHSVTNIKSAIETVLNDECYLKNMQRLSAISHDFTSQALDKAVFWVEHVARHGGASHLRPATADASLFEYFCLDIISVILAFSIVSLYVFVSIYRVIILCVSRLFAQKIKQS